VLTRLGGSGKSEAEGGNFLELKSSQGPKRKNDHLEKDGRIDEKASNIG